jgi:Tol biopolymer transport system component
MKNIVYILLLFLAIQCKKNDSINISQSLPFNIVYESMINGNSEIYILRKDKTILNLTKHPSFDGNAKLSPDGKNIYFLSSRNTNENNLVDIYKMDVSGNYFVNLTKDLNPYGDFNISNDSKHIVLLSKDINSKGVKINSIFLVDSSGKNIIQLTKEWNCENPVFSPDDKQIAFTYWKDGFENIFIMDVDGSNIKNITHNYGSYIFPIIFSKDGKRIFFNAYTDSDGYHVHQIDLANGEIKKLIDENIFIESEKQLDNNSNIIYAYQNSPYILEIYLYDTSIFEKELIGRIPTTREQSTSPYIFITNDDRYILLTLNVSDDPFPEDFIGDIFLFDIYNSAYYNLTNNKNQNNILNFVY